MKKTIITILGILIAVIVHAQNKPKASYNLVVETRSSYEWNTDSFQKWEWILKPELDYKLSKKVRFYVKGRLYTELMDNLESGRPLISETSKASQRHFMGSKSEWEFREVYLDLDFDDFGFTRIGKQQIVWGETDGLKLLDVVNPQNFREFILTDFDESRIPLWSVKHDFSVDKLNVQLVWIPDNTYHDLPALTDPFFPKSNLPPLGSNTTLLNSPQKPSRFFRDSEFGVKVNKFVNGWDVNFNYLYTFDDFAIFNIQALSSDPVYDVSVTP